MNTDHLERRSGFTLVELLVVMTIIGIIVSLVAIASFDSVQNANKRATQSLISKLDLAVSDRVEALLSLRIEPNGSHRFLAAIRPDENLIPVSTPPLRERAWGLQSEKRAEVIAKLDNLRAELPDVFFVQNLAPGNTDYPLNFAGLPYLDNSAAAATAISRYTLPMGNNVGPAYVPDTPLTAPFPVFQVGIGASLPLLSSGTVDPDYALVGTGIYGASYTVAAGIYKNLGYLPQGYNAVDDNQNGLVDEWGEGIGAGTANALTATDIAVITNRLAAHTHDTARSEMLYAILVDGIGPLGSVFSRSDFTDKEVRDTDNDGLPEFVDAWGKPLQFYRWPIFYSIPGTSDSTGQDVHGGVQRGPRPFFAFEERDRNPLDPQQHLMNPAWWLAMNNGNGSGGAVAPMGNVACLPTTLGSVYPFPNVMSAKAAVVQGFFGPLTDLNYGFNFTAVAGDSRTQRWPWERFAQDITSPGNIAGTLSFRRRAYYSKHLILSGGPDEVHGLPTYAPNPAGTALFNAQRLVGVWPYDDSATTPRGENNAFVDPLLPNEAGYDDISSHELNSRAGGAL